MHARKILARLLLTLSMCFAIPAWAQEETVWIADKNGCKVANPFPQPEETITWSGKCKNGFADGEGVLEWFVKGKSADRFEGMLEQGWAEGRGTLTRAEGSRYSGQWVRSMEEGEGRLDAPDGSSYEGRWKQGKPHGSGRYRTPDGRVISGEWVDGEYQDDETFEQDLNRT
ncbi:MAG: hypothetical protein ACKVP2_17105 [Burkholderiales bacterium]